MIKFTKINDQIIMYTASTLSVNSVSYFSAKKNYQIDSLLLPKDTKEILRFLKNKENQTYLINTHYHSDHSFGNKILRPFCKTIIGHKEYQRTISTEKDMLKKTSVKTNKEILGPEITFDKEYIVNDEVKLIHTPGHSFDSSVVYFGKDKTIVAGDTVLFNKNKYALPYFFWGDIYDLYMSLLKLDKMDIDLIIPGHGTPTKKDKLKTDLKYLDFLISYKEKVNEIDQEYLYSCNYTKVMGIDKIDFWNPDIHKFNVQKLIGKKT